MKTILCSQGNSEIMDKLYGLIETRLPQVRISLADSLDDLLETICRPLSRISVAIVVITSKDDIDDLLAVAHFFDNIRLILVMPDHDTGTVKKGLTLLPSYLSYSDSDFKDILSVLEKIWQPHKSASPVSDLSPHPRFYS